MPPWTFSWRLALIPLLLLPGTIRGGGCPQRCSCSVDGSVFCTQRRATSMPVGLPVSTRQLYVFQNGITTLRQGDVLGLEKLVGLDLSQNELAELPDGVFASLDYLRNLDLSSNHVGHVSKESFAGLANLERLYLHRNRIRTVHPDAFGGLKNLLELKLQGNQIHVLPALKLPRLLLLDISHNRVPLPGPEDLQTPHLESLKVAGLGLTTLNNGLLRSLGNLHDLDVSQNKLTELPAVLRSARGLIALSLGGNPMGPLSPGDFTNLAGLQKLDLSGLNLQGFPVGFLQMFPRLNHLTAAENPFNCVCALAWLPSWLKDKGVELGRKEETRCHFPPFNAGRTLFGLEHKDFGCSASITGPPGVLTTLRTAMTPGPATSPTPDYPSTLANPDRDSPSFPLPGSAGHEEHACPAGVCLNGGTCRFGLGGQIDCLCPPDTSGNYCENREDPRPSPAASAATAPPQPDTIGSHHVTGTSISLDLHGYIQARPHIRGIRLTYRNLSGPDRRPQHLSVPPSYPEYTLRGLQPNSTYVVCASPLGEPTEGGGTGSCMETRTSGVSRPPPGNEPEPFLALVPILVAVAVVTVLVLVVAAPVVVLCRRRRTGTSKRLDLADPSPLELEGVRMSLENGSASQKHPQTPLIREPFASFDSAGDRLPSYF